jgi:CTP synthase (UTP-ammonia lyase)
MAQRTPRIALVGDRSANVRAHTRIPGIIDALLTREAIALDPYWIATPDAAECELRGFDDSGQVRIVELPGHPFFIGTLFQPELHGDGTQPHPVIRALAAAAAQHAAAETNAWDKAPTV